MNQPGEKWVKKNRLAATAATEYTLMNWWVLFLRSSLLSVYFTPLPPTAVAAGLFVCFPLGLLPQHDRPARLLCKEEYTVYAVDKFRA